MGRETVQRYVRKVYREVSRRDGPSLNVGVVVGCRVAEYTGLGMYKGRYTGGMCPPLMEKEKERRARVR